MAQDSVLGSYLLLMTQVTGKVQHRAWVPTLGRFAMAGFDALNGFAHPIFIQALFIDEELHQACLIRRIPGQLRQLLSRQNAGFCSMHS